jgi:hypothetical protein
LEGILCGQILNRSDLHTCDINPFTIINIFWKYKYKLVFCGTHAAVNYLMAWQTLVWYWRSGQTSGEVVEWLCVHPSIVQGEISPAFLCKAINCSTSAAEEVNQRCIRKTTLGMVAADGDRSPLQSGNKNSVSRSDDWKCSTQACSPFNFLLLYFFLHKIDFQSNVMKLTLIYFMTMIKSLNIISKYISYLKSKLPIFFSLYDEHLIQQRLHMKYLSTTVLLLFCVCLLLQERLYRAVV